MLHNPTEINKSLYTATCIFTEKNIPNEIIDYILDLSFGNFNTCTMFNNNKIENIRKTYENVLEELLIVTKPHCKKNCKINMVWFFDGYACRSLFLTRSTHKICIVCNKNSVALYDFDVCYDCATKNEYPDEFRYYHLYCGLL